MVSKRVCDSSVGNDEEPTIKGHKTIQDEPPPSLNSLNDDCLVSILSFSGIEDLNSFAMCSKRCQAARAHESLDQSRGGTIIISHGCTAEALLEAVRNKNWNEEFQGNRVKLKIEGLERLPVGPYTTWEQSQLPGVKNLQLACCSDAGNQNVHTSRASFLSHLFPNLETLDLSSVTAFCWTSFCQDFCIRCPQLSQFTWNGCRGVGLTGIEFFSCARITKLHLDDCLFRVYIEHTMETFANTTNDNNYMFHSCRHLERLSIKNAVFTHTRDEANILPLPQAMLIKLVRCHPTLRWLQSDLSAENVAMLKQERPDITLVSD